MNSKLREGMKLSAIFWADDSTVTLSPNETGFNEITVVEVAGQMGYVPWARAVSNDGDVFFYNLAEAAGVRVLRDDATPN